MSEPNPHARLVGELPKLRERLAKAFAGPWVVNDKHEFGYWNVRQDPENWDGMGYQHICCLPTCGSKGSHYGDKFRASALLIAASPSAHAIAIEAIELAGTLQAENVELKTVLRDAARVVSDRAAGGRMTTTVYEAKSIFGRCLAALAAEPDNQKEK